jgi:hypothetical protein
MEGMVNKSHEKKVFMKDIYSYQKTNSILFSVAFCVVGILSFYIYQQTSIYLLPTKNAIIVAIQSDTYEFERLACSNHTIGGAPPNCTNVTIERPMVNLTLKYKENGVSRSFSSTFYGYGHEPLKVGDSMPINFYQNKPNLLIPSISRILFMSFVLLLGLASLFRWLLHSYQASQIIARQPNINIKSRYKERGASNDYAQLTGIFSCILYIFTIIFDAHILLILIAVLLVPALTTLAYVFFIARFLPKFGDKFGGSSAVFVWLASVLIAIFISIGSATSIEIYAPDSITIQLVLSALYFISLFNVKKLAHNN